MESPVRSMCFRRDFTIAEGSSSVRAETRLKMCHTIEAFYSYTILLFAD